MGKRRVKAASRKTNRTPKTKAVKAPQDGYKIVHNAKRRLQLHSEDSVAIDALKRLHIPSFPYVDSVINVATAHPVFDVLLRHPEEFLSVVQSGELVERTKGEVLCRYNDEGDTLFIILRGTIDIVLPQNTTISLGRGAIVGELAFALQRRRTATMRARTNCVLLSLNAACLADIPIARDNILRHVAVPRILQNIAEQTDYLRALRSAPHELHALSAKCELFRLDRDAHETFPKKMFQNEGLYVLTGGRLDNVNISEHRLDGTNYPIVHAQFGSNFFFHRDYSLSTARISVVHIPIAKQRLVKKWVLESIVESSRVHIRRGFIYDVFLSYNHDDLETANRWKKKLERRLGKGRVFMDDPHNLGQFDAALAEAILESLVMVPLISLYTNERPEWVRREINFRLKHYGQGYNASSAHLIPIALPKGKVDMFASGHKSLDGSRSKEDRSVKSVVEYVHDVKRGNKRTPFASSRISVKDILEM